MCAHLERLHMANGNVLIVQWIRSMTSLVHQFARLAHRIQGQEGTHRRGAHLNVCVMLDSFTATGLYSQALHPASLACLVAAVMVACLLQHVRPQYSL